MSVDQTKGPAWAFVRLVLLVIGGIVLAQVLVSLLIHRDTGLGLDDLLVFGGGALLGVLIEFVFFRRTRR